MTMISNLPAARRPGRPLELARAVQAGPCTTMFDQKPLPSLRGTFRSAVPVLLDQICDWWNTIPLSDRTGPPPPGVDTQWRQWPDERLEVNWRLPWPIVWAEWCDSDARVALSGETVKALRMGALLTETTPAALAVAMQRLLPNKPIVSDTLAPYEALKSYPYIVSASLVVQDHDQRHPPRVSSPIFWGASETGVPSYGLNGQIQYVAIGSTEEAQFCFEMLGVWKLFTALLNVRGTETPEVPISRGIRRAWERSGSGAPPFVSYRTLAVRLPRQLDEGDGDGTGQPLPLHIVRGHIADYRHGNGLFGKYKQLVWMPSHLRGDAAVGAVAKTYAADL